MKILASDYDGTLNVSGTVSEENLRAIEAWRAAGNVFCMVSGRYLTSIRNRLTKDGVIYDYLIANNGSVITNGQGEVVCRTCILPHKAKALLDEIIKYPLHHISISFGQTHLLVRPDSKVYADEFALTVDGNRIEHVTQISATLLCPEEAHALRDACQSKLGDHIRGKMPTVQSIDFNRTDVGKDEGIRRLVAEQGLAPDVIITVGDGENDLDMLLAPDFCGYAMQNSMPGVLGVVDRRTESVAVLIKEYL